MKIPSKFKLFGQTINVLKNDSLAFANGTIGEAHIGKNKIVLQRSTKDYKMTKEQEEATYFHELTHMILFLMGKEMLAQDEEFVSIFSNLLHQAIVSAEYNKED